MGQRPLGASRLRQRPPERDFDTPEGEVANTQSRRDSATSARRGPGRKGFFGASYGYDDTKYGVPVIEEGQVELTPRRHMVSAKAGASA